MRSFPVFLGLLFAASVANAQDPKTDIPYGDEHQRQVLDVYSPDGAKGLPVMFWIHGGGWQAGDKSDVALKPAMLMARGFVFVSTNYRLLPDVEMDVLTRDVAKSLGRTESSTWKLWARGLQSLRTIAKGEF